MSERETAGPHMRTAMATFWPPTPDRLQLMKQLGINDMILWATTFPTPDALSFKELVNCRTLVESHGLSIAAVEGVSAHFYDKIFLGKPGRDQQIEDDKRINQAVGRAGHGQNRLSFAPLPLDEARGGPVLGGAGIGILSGCRHLDLAARHIAWLTSPDIQRGFFAFSDGKPAQCAARENPAVDSYVNGFFSVARQAVETAYVRPNSPRFGHFWNVAAGMLHDGVTGRSTIFQVLDTITQAWLQPSES